MAGGSCITFTTTHRGSFVRMAWRSRAGRWGKVSQRLYNRRPRARAPRTCTSIVNAPSRIRASRFRRFVRRLVQDRGKVAVLPQMDTDDRVDLNRLVRGGRIHALAAKDVHVSLPLEHLRRRDSVESAKHAFLGETLQSRFHRGPRETDTPTEFLVASERFFQKIREELEVAFVDHGARRAR